MILIVDAAPGKTRASFYTRVAHTVLYPFSRCIIVVAVVVVAGGLLFCSPPARPPTHLVSPMASDPYGSPDDGLELERIAVRDAMLAATSVSCANHPSLDRSVPTVSLTTSGSPRAPSRLPQPPKPPAGPRAGWRTP